jgi:hypothetical protein
LDPRDRAQQLSRRCERADLLLDHFGEPPDPPIEVGEDRRDDQSVLRVEAALERLPERRDLRTQLAASELGEQLRVGRAGDERVEHRPA